MEESAADLGNGVFALPDGSERFLLTEALLDLLIQKYGLRYLEAPKSALVHGQRAMGVFVWEKVE
jgi:hypothetical protein